MIKIRPAFLCILFLIIGTLSIENRANFSSFAGENVVRCVLAADPARYSYSNQESYNHSKFYQAKEASRRFGNSSELAPTSQATLYASEHGYFGVRVKPEHNSWHYNQQYNQQCEEAAFKQQSYYSPDFDNKQTITHEEVDPKIEEEACARRKELRLAQRKRKERNARYSHEIKKRLESSSAYLENYIVDCRDQINDSAINSDHKVRLQQRIDAIEQSQSNFFAPRINRYTLSDQTQQFLEDCNVKTDAFILCHGSLIQQQLHGEVVDIVEKASTIYLHPNQNESKKIISKTIGQLAEVAIGYNEQGNIPQAIAVTDCCDGLLGCALGVGDGIVDGLSNLVNTAIHPIDTMVGFADTVRTAAFCMGKVLHEVCDVTIALCQDRDAGLDKLNQNLSAISDTIYVIGDKLKNMSTREKARMITAIAVEALLTKKCLGAMNAFYQEAQTGLVTVMRNIDKGMSPKVAFAGMPHVSVATQGAEYATLLAESGGELKAKSRLFSLLEKKPSQSGNITNKTSANVKQSYPKQYGSQSQKTNSYAPNKIPTPIPNPQPYGVYHDAGYHYKGGPSGLKSPAPINGQAALNNSFEIKNLPKQRVGISENQIVILKKTAEEKYHGYVPTWEYIRKNQNIYNTLIENNLVNKKGRIL